MKETTISQLKKGDFFTLIPIEEPKDSQVYVRDDYVRSTKKYEAYKFEDVNRFRQFKGDTKVYIDFIF